jgi:hypothetical protein
VVVVGLDVASFDTHHAQGQLLLPRSAGDKTAKIAAIRSTARSSQVLSDHPRLPQIMSDRPRLSQIVLDCLRLYRPAQDKETNGTDHGSEGDTHWWRPRTLTQHSKGASIQPYTTCTARTRGTESSMCYLTAHPMRTLTQHNTCALTGYYARNLPEQGPDAGGHLSTAPV